MAGLEGGVGSPVQTVSPVRRYVSRWRRASRSSIVAPATASLSSVIVVLRLVFTGQMESYQEFIAYQRYANTANLIRERTQDMLF